MKLFGITGGVGMGKSTAGEILRQQGIAVADTDVIARQLVERGQPALREIENKFGPSILHPDGQLNREELARRVFGEPQARRELEAILHPRIRKVWKAEAQRWRAGGKASGAVIIPLLFETKARPLFDATVCVACTAATQHQRLLKRGWTAEGIKQRLDAQWPVERKIALSDFMVWTDVPLEAHAAQWELILAGR